MKKTITGSAKNIDFKNKVILQKLHPLASPSATVTSKLYSNINSPSLKTDMKWSSDPQFGIVITHKSSSLKSRVSSPMSEERLYNFPARAVIKSKKTHP